jgi:conjugal transfer/type IV secretion protein DotA/TraY
MVGTVLVLISAIGGILRITTTGEIIGGSWRRAHWPLAVVLGFGLILPAKVQDSDISNVQVASIQAIAWGVKQAEELWDVYVDKALDTPVSSPSPTEGRMIAGKILKALTCEYYLAGNEGRLPAITEFSERAQAAIISAGDRSGIDIGINGRCGTIAVDLRDERLGWFNNEYATILARAENEALTGALAEIREVIRPLSELAARIAKPEKYDMFPLWAVYNDSDRQRANEHWGEWRTRFLAIADGLSGRLSQRIHYDYIASNPDMKEALATNLKSLGFARAGTAYQQLTKFDRSVASIYVETVSAVEAKTPIFNYVERESGYTMDMDAHADMFIADVFRSRRAFQDETQAARKVAELNIQSVCSKDDCSGEAATKKVTQYVMSALMQTEPGDNSFTTVQNIGGNMLRVTGVLLAAKGGLAITAESVRGVSDSVVGLAGGGVIARGVAAAIDLVIQMLDFAIKWIAGSAIVLTVILPLLPTLMWMAMLVNWLIKTIVMLIAMPLVAVANVGPTEGSALGGGLVSRGMVQALGVVLMPPLMILGLAASLSVSSVGFQAMHSIMMASMGIHATGLFTAIAMVVMYAVAAVLVHLTSLYLSAKIPEQVMDWLAMGTGGQDGSVVATETKQMHSNALRESQQASPNLDLPAAKSNGGDSRPAGIA